MSFPRWYFASRVQQLFPDGEEGACRVPCTGRGGSRGEPRVGPLLRGAPDPVTKLTDRRIAYLVRQAQTGFRADSLGSMAARWGVSRRRLNQVLQLSRVVGGAPLLKTTRRPPEPPLTAPQIAEIEVERQRTRRGATKLYQGLLRRGVRIPKMKIYRYAQEQGWVVPNPRKQRPRSYVRYERLHSGSLLHGDYHRTSEQHPHCILWEDDASRMILSGGEFPSATTEGAIATLREALRRAREWTLEVREVNTDRGSQFFANPYVGTERTEHAFGRFLESVGVRHVVSRVNHPQTNGKLERLWREYDLHRWRFDTLEEFIDWSNGQIHDALWLKVFETPSEAWQRKLPTEVLLGLHLRSVEGVES
jgi:putative transposase